MSERTSTCICGGEGTDTGYGDIHTTDCILDETKRALFLAEVERRAGANPKEILRCLDLQRDEMQGRSVFALWLRRILGEPKP